MITCLFCGHQVKRRGFASHQRSKSHFGKDYTKYDRMMRLAAFWYNRKALEELTRKFIFARVAQ